MSQIGNVAEIKAVKHQFDQLKNRGLVKEWEIPYENILTRLTAAIFFLTPAEGVSDEAIWNELGEVGPLSYQLNETKQLSDLQWQVEFK